MKNWIKKIGQNKYQFFFFIGIASLLVFSIIVASITPSKKVDKPTPPEIENPPIVKPDEDDDVIETATEFVTLPFDQTKEYQVVRKFYEKDASKEDQIKALIKFQNSYRTSLGTSYALKNGEYFDVLASLSGTVCEVGNSPLFGNYVVIKTEDDIKTYYYGLSEVTVTKGTEIKQGTKLGVAGNTTVDQETGIHVYFQISKGGKYLNPEKVIGSKPTDL